MGVVYKAEDTDLDRVVALKFLSPNIASDSEERIRLVAEAKAAASLNHPNIATIYAIEEVDDVVFIAMEYVERQELRDIIKSRGTEEGRLPFDTIRNYLVQIAEALQVAHDKGVVHRDIKSANIKVAASDQVKIMDFGLARMSGQAQVTKTGHSLGTPSYMSPEQTRGEPLDHRTDIWSLGVVAYEMITGQLPFTGDYELAVAYSIVNEEPRPIQELRPEVTEDLRQLVSCAMAKDRDMRYSSARELAAALGQSQPSQPRPSLQTSSARKTTLSRRSWATLATLLVLLTVFLISRLFKSETAVHDTPSIAVMPFEYQGDQEFVWLASAVSELMASDLARDGSVRVLDRQQRMRIMQNLGLKTKKVGEEQALRVGAQARAQHVVLGSLRKPDDRIEVSAQIMETESQGRQGQPIRVDGLHSNLHQVAHNLADRVREALKIEPIAAGEKARPPMASLDAFRYYVEGLDAAFDRRHEESIDKLIRATTLDTTFIEAFYQLAWQYGEIGNREMSMKIMARIRPHISSLSEKDRLRYFREEAKYQRRWTDYALYLEKLLSLDAFDAMDHFRYGWVQAYKFRRHDAGIAAIQKSLQLDSTFAEAYNRLGYIFLAKGDKQQAHAMIDKYLDLNPADVNPLDSKAEIQLYTGLYNEAARNCQRILDMKPNFLRSRLVLIQVLMAQGRYALALQDVSRYMTLATSLRDMSKGQSLQAEVHLQLGELEKALNSADQGVTLDSTNAEARWRRARILAHMKNSQAARQEVVALNRALKTWGALDGKWLVHHAEGVIALQAGAFDRAKERFRSALQLGPWDRSIYAVALAEAYAMAGQWHDAVGQYNAALAFNPNSAAAAFGLGRAYEQLDQVAEARQAFTRALNIWSQADREIKEKQVAKTKMASLNN